MTHKGSIVNNLHNSPSQIIFLLSFFLWKVAFIHPFHPLKFTTEADPPGPSNGVGTFATILSASFLELTDFRWRAAAFNCVASTFGSLWSEEGLVGLAGWCLPTGNDSLPPPKKKTQIFTLGVPIGGNLGFLVYLLGVQIYGKLFRKLQLEDVFKKEFIDLFMNIVFEERTKTWGKSKT